MSDRINIGLRENSNGIHVGIREDAIYLEVLAGGAGGGGGVAIQGSGSYIYDNGTAVFETSPTVTFGLATNGVMTASALQSTHNHPYLGSGESTYYQTSNLSSVFLTTAAQSNHTHSQYINTSVATNFAGIGTAGTNVTMTLNSNGLSLSVDPPGAGGGGAALKGSGTYTQNSGTIEFANSNSITFGLTSNQMTASFSQSTHDHPYINTSVSSAFLTTAALSNHTHDYQSTGNYLTTAMQSDMTSVLQYTSNTSNITANAVNTSITSQWLTTAALSNHTHDQYVNTSISSQWLTTAMASQNTSLFLYTSASSLLQHTSATSAITSAAFPSANTTKFAGSGFTTTAITGTEVQATHDSLGLKIAIPAYITTYAAGGGEIAVSAGASSDDLASVVFSNSNGVAFGLNGSTITASYSQSTHDHPYIASESTSVFAYTSNSSLLQHTSATSAITANAVNTSVTSQWLTTAALSNHTHSDLYINTSVSGSFQLTSDNSLSLGTGYTTHTHDYQSTGAYLTTAALSDHTHSNLYIALANSTAYATSVLSATFQTTGAYLTTAAQSNAVVNSINGSTGVFSFNTGSSLSSSRNGNSITWGLASNITSALQSAGAYLTTAMASANTSLFVYTSASSLFQHTSATSAITASALNTSQSSLFQQTSATSAITANAINTSVSGSFQLTANNSLSLDTGYTTHTHLYQSTGAYLTTAALSDHTHSNLYIALGNSTAYQTSVLSGTFQTTGAYLTTAMAFDAGSRFVGLNSSTNTITGTDVIWTINSSGISVNMPKFITTYAGDGGGADWSISSTAGTNIVISTGAATNTLYQPNFITTYAGGAGSVYAGDNITLSTVGGSTSVSVYNTSNFTYGHSAFVGLLSTGLTGGSWTINSSQLSLNIPSNAGSLGFNDSNGVTFGIASTTSNSSTVVTASIAAFIGTATTITTTSGTDLKITAGTAGLNVAHPAWITTYTPGAGGGEWTVATTGGTDLVVSTATNTNTIYYPRWITTYTAGGGEIDISAGTASAALGSVVFSNSNGVSFGLSGSTITASAAGGGGAALKGSGTYSQNTGTIEFSASNGITFGLTNNVMTASLANNAGSLGFNDSNGVTFGIASTTSNSSTIVTASIAAYAGTSFSTVSTAGSVLLGGMNTAGLSLSVPAWLTAAAGGGGTSIVPGNYLSSSLNGSTLSLSVTGLQATSATSAITASAMNTSERANYFYTSNNTFVALASTTNFAGVGETTAGAISMTVNTAGVNASVPAVGYLSLVNSAGYTWSTSVNGVSTAIWLVLA